MTGGHLGKGNIGDYIGRSNRKFKTFTQKNYLTQFLFVHLLHVLLNSISTDVVYDSLDIGCEQCVHDV